MAKTFKVRVTRLKGRHILEGLLSSYRAKMTSSKALDWIVCDCIDPVDRISAFVELPTDGSSSTEDLALEQGLQLAAAALQRFVPEVERRSKDLDFKVSQKVIQGTSIRWFFGQVKTGKQKAVPFGDVFNAYSTTVPTHVSQRRRELHRDGAEPPHSTTRFDLSLLHVELTYSTQLSLSGRGGDTHRVSSSATCSLPSPRVVALTCRVERKMMPCYRQLGSLVFIEGQTSEPSGAVVNFENDTVVDDANNHRIQIFDREIRFKFQFGEVGRGDGQLFVPI